MGEVRCVHESDEFGPALRGRGSRVPRPRLRRGDRGERTPRASRRPEGKRRRRRGRGALGTLGKALGLVVLLVAGLGAALLLYASSQLEREPVDGLASGGRPTNVLLIGSDSREGMTREEQNELTTGREGGDLADTILVLSFQGGETALLSFPRDLYVTRCDGSQGRINAAVNVGGTSCLVDTITRVSGIPIHHTMEVRFLGFRDLVDAVGGVELCLDDPIRDAAAGIDLQAGCQTLDGGDALGYVRVRKIDSDFGRIERQQEFLKALAAEVAEPRTLVDVPRLFRLASAGGSAVTASEETGPLALAHVGWGMRGLAGGAPTYTVPANPMTVGGAAVLALDDTEAPPLFERFRSGAILSEAAADPDAVQREDVDVAVLNGAGVEGLAGNVADELRARGFGIADVGNADRTPQTVVRHPSGERDAAELLAREIPVDVELEEAGVAAVTLVLGEDLRD